MDKSNKIKFRSNKYIPKSSDAFSLMAENLLRQVFGKKYYGMASAFNNESYFKKNLTKLIDQLVKDTSALIAPEVLIDNINYQLGYFKKEINEANEFSPELRGALVISLKIIATLIGYRFLTGDKKNEPFFVPSLWSEMQGWNNLSEYLDTKEYLNNQSKIEIIKQLVAKRHTATEIAVILNISGYKVAQLLKQVREIK